MFVGQHVHALALNVPMPTRVPAYPLPLSVGDMLNKIPEVDSSLCGDTQAANFHHLLGCLIFL